VDIDYLDEAIEQLKMYAREVEANGEDLCEQLALIAMDEAQSRYDAVADDIVVEEPAPIKNGFKVSAYGTRVEARDGTTGNSVTFAEFGAGTRAGDGHPWASEFQAFPGTWSIHDARQWARYGYWYYDGERYEAIAPSKAMYYASDLARRRTAEIAWEIFR